MKIGKIIIGDSLPPETLSTPILTESGQTQTLASLWKEGACLIGFLRHFGCLACSEFLSLLLPRVPELTRLGVSVQLVGNGAPNFIAGFLERHNLRSQNISVYTDPTLTVFDRLGFKRGAGSMLQPRALFNGFRAMAGGHTQTTIEGEPTQQGGVLLVDSNGIVRHYHADRAFGDHADPAAIVTAALKLSQD